MLFITMKLDLFTLFSNSTLRNRNTVKLISRKIKKAKEVILDFEKIDFISKSFAHELKKFVKNSDKKIRMINKNQSIRQMLLIANIRPEIKYYKDKMKAIEISA